MGLAQRRQEGPVRLEVSRQKRNTRPNDAPTYVVSATLRVSSNERNDIDQHGLAQYELDLDEDDDEAEVVPLVDLLNGRDFSFENARDAGMFEELLLAAASEFAQLVIDSVEFGGSDQYELPLEEDIDDEDDDED